MTINVSNNDPRVNYTATSGQTAFTIPFDYFDDGDINVYKNGTLLTITTHYTISGSTMTLVTGATAGDKIALTRDVPLDRTTDLTSTYNATSLNDQLDRLVAQVADLDDRVSRSVSLNDYEVGVSLDLPATADRLGKTIQFNASTGALEVGPSGDELTSIASIASEITALDGISSNITTVAGAISNVNSVGTNISSVNSVAGSISNVNNVNTNIANVNLVGASIANVNDVADSIDQVELVAGSISNVDTVALANTNISTVAGAVSNINTLASSVSNVALVAGALSNINTTVTNLANINTVGNNIDDVNDVANVITKVTTVADNISNVNLVAPEVSYLSTVANNISVISTVGQNISDIQGAITAASNAATSASNAATSETNAATSASNAATSESNAAASASSASSAQTSAESARDATLAAFDSFDDRYLGSKTADPSLDNDGNALVGGALYYNSTDEVMKVYTGSQWVAAYASLSGALLVSNNLSDLNNAASARTNLGLGTAATTASTDYAAAVHTHTLSSITDAGTAAAAATTDFATAAQGATADAALPKAGGTMTGALNFGDNVKAQFGASSDLQIYHSGSGSFISDQGSGPLTILTSGFNVINPANTETLIDAVENGAVQLYYDNAAKLSTTSTGIDVTGQVRGVDRYYFKRASDNYSLSALARWDGSTGSPLTGTAGIHTVVGSEEASGSVILAPSNVEKVRIDSSGNVGIGTSSPSGSLHISTGLSGTTASAGYNELVIEGGNEDIGMVFLSPAANNRTQTIAFGDSNNNSSGEIAYEHANDAMSFDTSGTERMRIDSSGNVGIGTSSPNYTFETVGNVGLNTSGTSVLATFGANNTTDKYLRLRNSSGNFEIGTASGGHYLYGNGSLPLQFFTSATERCRIDASGNLLVGKTSAAFGTTGVTLNPDGSNNMTRASDPPLALNRLTSDGSILGFYKDGSTVGSIYSRSGVALGIDSPSGDIGFSRAGTEVLYVGNSQIYPATDNFYSVGGSNYRFKDGYFSGTVNAANFNTTSDKTLKTNVETLTGSLDAVKALRGVSFDWIDNGNSEVGVIAQEVEAVIPDLVSTNDEGIKSVKYGNMVAVLIEAIKEQQAQIDELKAKLGE